ncbi:MAG: hypothetical protein FWD77_07395 [Betaproteobacteria bacterium]|nr:hypothetical protein [Betaproteobacteria bacterium]
MKQPVLHALGGATLAVSVFLAPMSVAMAQQTFTVPVPGPYADICGNALVIPPSGPGLCSSGYTDDDANEVTVPAGITVGAGATSAIGRYDYTTTADAHATGNTVYFDAVGIGTVYGGYAESDDAPYKATANENWVWIQDSGASAQAVIGGYALGRSSAQTTVATANNNEVDIDNGTFGSVGSTTNIYGGYAAGGAFGNHTVSAVASLNKIIISGGTFFCGEITGGAVNNAIPVANGNTVIISGGTLSGTGFCDISGGTTGGAWTTGTAKDNLVSIGNLSVGTKDVRLHGGIPEGDGLSSGNTLEVTAKQTAYSAEDFQNLVFDVPASLTVGQTMLTLTFQAYFDTPSAPPVKVNIGAGSTLQPNDQIVLIDVTGSVNPDPLHTSLSTTSPVTSDTSGWSFKIVGNPQADKKLVVQVLTAPPTAAPHIVSTDFPSTPVQRAGALFTVKLDQDGGGHWQVIDDTTWASIGSACPAAGAASYTFSRSMSGNTSYTPYIAGAAATLLDASTHYYFCFYADNVIGASSIWNEDFTTAALPPPTLTGPTISGITSAGASFSVTSDQDATIYWGTISSGGTCSSDPGMYLLHDTITAGTHSETLVFSSSASSPVKKALSAVDEILCVIAQNAHGTSAPVSKPFTIPGAGGSGGTPGTGGTTPGGGGTTPGGDGTTPSSGNFADGDTLAAGGSYTAPSGTPSFCLGGGSAPVTLSIDGVSYAISPVAENTCFEIFSAGSGRALILDSGTAEVSTSASGVPLLEARNGQLVVNNGNGKIRVTVDPTCTSTRVSIVEGQVSAPSWITSPMPASGCPADAITPANGSFMVGSGKLACNPSALTIKGTWAKLTVKHTQNLNAGEQYFVVAGYAPAGWFQNNSLFSWQSLDDPLLPLFSASEAGSKTITLVDRLDIRDILGTELYVGDGSSEEEMMMNDRYCGVFRAAP